MIKKVHLHHRESQLSTNIEGVHQNIDLILLDDTEVRPTIEVNKANAMTYFVDLVFSFIPQEISILDYIMS